MQANTQNQRICTTFNFTPTHQNPPTTNQGFEFVYLIFFSKLLTFYFTIFAPMKLFAFFMAIYILVLSAVPCSDVHNDCNNSKSKTELTQNHDHQQDQDDNCSPFCTCACCGASVVAIDFTPFQIKKPAEFLITQKISLRNFSFISNFYGNIWQPPKINV